MSRPVPRFRRHKNGQAVVQHKGVRRYLGPYGLELSKKRYRQFIARLEAGVQPTPAPIRPSPDSSALRHPCGAVLLSR